MSGTPEAPRLCCGPAGHWALLGDVTQSSVPGVYRESLRQPVAAGMLVLDLSGVERIDSAALALLLSIARRVRGAGGRLDIRHPPAGLVALAGMTGVATLLQLAAA